SVFADAKRVGFKLENTIVISRTIEGQYPDYERVIPKDLPVQIAVKREQLINAIRRAIIFSRDSHGKPVSIQVLPDGGMVVSTEQSEAGTYREEIDCRVLKGSGVQIAFNGGYLLETLARIGTDKGLIGLSEPVQPAVFKPMKENGEEGEVFVLAPLNLG
ncbi:DNA polymerase III subunit beta, partial [Thermogutta sp.]|uniref:DNA polymerase III subunit beta n=1 Tax=Thermogutta sp. TaxID=1962930 RepID=UPI0032203257